MKKMVTMFAAGLAIATLQLACDDDKPAPDPAKTAKAEVERGRYLLSTSGCHDCHTPWTMGPEGPHPDMTRALSGHPASLKMPPAPELQHLMDIIDEAKISGKERQIELAHELFRIWADEVYEIGTVGLTPMVQGVIVANLKLHNVPETAGNDWPLRTPGNTRPEQYFFEQ